MTAKTVNTKTQPYCYKTAGATLAETAKEAALSALSFFLIILFLPITGIIDAIMYAGKGLSKAADFLDGVLLNTGERLDQLI